MIIAIEQPAEEDIKNKLIDNIVESKQFDEFCKTVLQKVIYPLKRLN